MENNASLSLVGPDCNNSITFTLQPHAELYVFSYLLSLMQKFVCKNDMKNKENISSKGKPGLLIKNDFPKSVVEYRL